MKTTKKQIKKVLFFPRLHTSLVLAREVVKIKRDQYKGQYIYYEALDEVIEDLDNVLFLIAQLKLEEKENK